MSFCGITVSQLDAPFFIASLAALLVLLGREFLKFSLLSSKAPSFHYAQSDAKFLVQYHPVVRALVKLSSLQEGQSS